MKYVQLRDIGELPDLQQGLPFKSVLAIETPVSPERQAQIARWLVREGCLCIMVCGKGSESWQASIRSANLELVDIENMRPEEFVMVTLHPHERLRSVFWHAKKVARHSHARLEQTLILHLGEQNRSVEYLAMFDKA